MLVTETDRLLGPTMTRDLATRGATRRRPRHALQRILALSAFFVTMLAGAGVVGYVWAREHHMIDWVSNGCGHPRSSPVGDALIVAGAVYTEDGNAFGRSTTSFVQEMRRADTSNTYVPNRSDRDGAVTLQAILCTPQGTHCQAVISTQLDTSIMDTCLYAVIVKAPIASGAVP